MHNRAAKIITLTILGFFMFSLVSMEHFQPQKVTDLQDLIVQAQKLQETSENSRADFNSLFSSTITVLQQVAGLQTVVTTHSDATKSAQVHFAVKIKSPFFFVSTNTFPAKVYSQSIPFITYTNSYKSYIGSPETPPPIPS